ncbi:MAG: hypothetical protein IS632_08335 [Thaumarchaeota archaeon]|nr:hypothetical protein [Nitrososphaerota archaeon]
MPQDATHIPAQIRGLAGGESVGRLGECPGRTADTTAAPDGRMPGRGPTYARPVAAWDLPGAGVTEAAGSDMLRLQNGRDSPENHHAWV